MIVYVNGDSHSAGAQAVNPYCFANDDALYVGLGRQAHPDNLRVSYGCEIANKLNAMLDCDAESASSNARIIRTTRDYLKNNSPDLIIIGWSNWTREEYLYDGIYWQIAGVGVGLDWPAAVVEWHRDWVINNNYNQRVIESHNAIWEFHQELEHIPHLFFNCYDTFTQVPKRDWGDSYVGPYDHELTYRAWLNNRGFQTVNPGSHHYGADAHRAWAEFLYTNYDIICKR